MIIYVNLEKLRCGLKFKFTSINEDSGHYSSNKN